jgi:hypothetical protein
MAYTEDKEGNGLDAKTTPVDADLVTLWDSVAGVLSKVTWANVKATLKTYFDAVYAAPSLDALSTPFLVAASGTQLSILANTYIKVINAGVHTILSFDANTTFAVADKLDTGAIGEGLDYYVYVCDDGQIKVSLNSTYPAGYSANNSRKIGGFHTLCDAVGTIAGHTLTTYATAAILPASVWCLNFRPRCSPEGMVYSDLAKIWVDIYLQSSTGATTASINGATITDTRVWMDHVDDLAAVGKKLLNDSQFQIIALGSNLRTNIYGSQDPILAGKCAPFLFTGAGLNNLTVNRTGFNHAAGAQEYEFEIDATGTPDTVKWRQKNFGGSFGGYTSGVSTAAPITIDGAVFTFAASTGHTLGNKWNFYIMNGMRDTAGRRMISNIGVEGAAGAMYQWLQDSNWQFAAAANTYAAASQTYAPTHAASPGGNPIYVKFTLDGTPYLCCNMAAAGVDKVITFGSYKLTIKHDAAAAADGLQLYFDHDATQPLRLLIVNPLALNTYAFSNDPIFMLILKHDASAATNGVAVNYDDTDNRIEYISPNGLSTNTMDLCYGSTAPTWGWYDLGTQGQIYKQGSYGDTKLLAGGHWAAGSSCGPRCRYAANSRWSAVSSSGARGCAEPK